MRRPDGYDPAMLMDVVQAVANAVEARGCVLRTDAFHFFLDNDMSIVVRLDSASRVRIDAREDGDIVTSRWVLPNGNASQAAHRALSSLTVGLR